MPPTAYEGFWGKPTSTIDWCEKNYEVSYYIAEWWNTISNLMIILPPLWGIMEVIRQGYESRFIFCNFLVCVVGIGSWCFHMTLRYEMQLFDELPMVYGILFQLYCLSEAPKPENIRFFSNKMLFTFLFAFALLFTAIYLLWPQPIFQHTSYGVILIWSWFLEFEIVRKKQCKVCKRLLITAVSLTFLAFFLWNVDKIFCSSLETIRSSAPMGTAVLTQLHAVWHALAGYASYLQVLFCIHTWYDYHRPKGNKRKLYVTNLGFSLRWS